jgi:ribosomal protein S18 acetylase RimI-like enzyme
MQGNLVHFRPAIPADASAIADVHDAAWRGTYQGVIPHLHLERMMARRGPSWWQRQIKRGSKVTVLVYDGVPQGYAAWGEARGAWPWPAGEIFELYIAPVFQGVGLGSRLFDSVRKELKRAGFARLVVWALKDNEAACAFYGGLGGVPVAALPERFGDTSLTRVAFAWGVNVKKSSNI